MIPINLLLWGYIGYYIYNFFHSEVVELPIELPVNLSKKKVEDSVNYVLALNYADPFLKEEPKPKNNSGAKAINQPIHSNPVVQKIREAPKTLDIKYMGLIENKTTGIVTGLISINGRSFLIKKGEIVEGVLVKSLMQDKLELRVGKDNLTISK